MEQEQISDTMSEEENEKAITLMNDYINGAIKVAVTGNIYGCAVNGQLVQTVAETTAA